MAQEEPARFQWNPAEIGALAHLYRGEMYRSKVWRTRLDGTTNWAVGTTGIGLSVTFSNPENSPLTLMLVAFLVLVFLSIEARRYRYFDIWRTRVRLMEVNFYGPMLRGAGTNVENGWNEALARDLDHLRFHISYWEALGRRFRRNYLWIFVVLGASFIAKIMVHPVQVQTWSEFWMRASVGPVPGQAVLAVWALGFLILILAGLGTLKQQHAAGRVAGPQDEDPMSKFGMKV